MIERHPYGLFLPKKPKSIIIGSFPIGKFSNPKRHHEIKEHEMDFFFGGEKNLLWKLLGHCCGVELKTKQDVIKLLEQKGIAVGDVIVSCRRKEGRASDSDLYDIKWNKDLIDVIKKNKIKRLYFTSMQVHKWFKRLFEIPQDIEVIQLISPSAQSARALVRMQSYIVWKSDHPDAKTIEFIYDSYRKVFN